MQALGMGMDGWKSNRIILDSMRCKPSYNYALYETDETDESQD